MKHLVSICLLFAVLLPFSCFAQEKSLLDDVYRDSLPKSEEEFIKSHYIVLNTIAWLINTPRNTFIKKRKDNLLLLHAWVHNSPTVYIAHYPEMTPFAKKNPELLTIFYGGWVYFTLNSENAFDEADANFWGIEYAISVYEKGNGIVKDSAMDTFVTLKKDGKLKKWVKDTLAVLKANEEN